MANTSVSAASKISEISQTSAESTSDFLEAKIAALEDDKAYLRCIREGLDEAKVAGCLTDAAFQEQIGPFLTRFRSTASTLDVLKRQRKLLEEDLEEEVALMRQRLHEPPDEGLLERAYRDTIIPRVMGASAKRRNRPFNQRQFKIEVNRYYGLTANCPKGSSYCHILGFFLPAPSVKVAHLVPKSLTQEEVAHLFGVEDGVLSDHRNTLSLSSPVKVLLDQGVIAVVPIPGEMTTPTTWRCVVLDESKNENIAHVRESGELIRVKDLDGRVLSFLSDNRPRRQYLYFRFLISYLNAKRLNLGDVTGKVETRRFWPSGGAYLHKSTLKTLARCVSGCDLPDDLIHNKTFETSSNVTRDVEAGMILGADVRDAQRVTEHSGDCPDIRDTLVESIRRL